MEIFGILFSWIDLAVLGLVSICLVFGLISGFVMQLAGILSVITGILFSVLFSNLVTSAISPRWIESQRIAHLLASMSCFFMGATIVRYLAALISSFLKRFSLEKFDRFVGGVLGIVKGLVIAGVVLLILGNSKLKKFEEPVKQSFSGRNLVKMLDYAVKQVKEKEVVTKVKKTAEKLLKKAKKITNGFVRKGNL